MRRFEQITLDQILLSGCAIVFGACILIQHAQAQPGYVPPPTPLPPPVFNPSNPGTMPQPPYTPITPTTPSAVPGNVVTRQRLKTCRKRPLALTDGHQWQRGARSATGAAPQSFVQHRRLIPTITRRSGMAMVARGNGDGTAIGSARRPVRDRKAVFPLKNRGRRHRPAKQRASFR